MNDVLWLYVVYVYINEKNVKYPTQVTLWMVKANIIAFYDREEKRTKNVDVPFIIHCHFGAFRIYFTIYTLYSLYSYSGYVSW